MNTEVMFSSKTDLWETPQDFFDKLNEEFHFDIDVCALPENAKCERYYTPEMDGLSRRGMVFVGATRPIAGRPGNGSRRRTTKPGREIARL